MNTVSRWRARFTRRRDRRRLRRLVSPEPTIFSFCASWDPPGKWSALERPTYASGRLWRDQPTQMVGSGETNLRKWSALERPTYASGRLWRDQPTRMALNTTRWLGLVRHGSRGS